MKYSILIAAVQAIINNTMLAKSQRAKSGAET